MLEAEHLNEDEGDLHLLDAEARRIVKDEVLKHLKKSEVEMEEIKAKFEDAARRITHVAIQDFNNKKKIGDEESMDESFRNTLKSKLLKLARDGREVELVLTGIKACIRDLKHLNLTNEMPDVSDMLKNYIKSDKQPPTDDELLAGPLFERWNRKLKSASMNEDGIMMESSNSMQSKCPITGLPLNLASQPLKNRSCGHFYSTAGINEYLKTSGNPDLKCPIAGCSHSVTRSLLARDEEFEYELKQAEN
mmetsp:Transcript_7013/g.9114  ORF Transcript_7013/g.9114 Transcript_7013/m.9114 type:complete len:249 (+) Transcript_7013:206-952(+)|eukprot:CAMPEP_0184022746 /NCGR_PEP_ID=MMETSP0954-20121128/10823_1 /TAXON_ID=627963 /ORGANISM="Aplanochytrium sp, Strain PBS07" /LENGTH=248 /DNA_ID=CAMNT_0026305247 /DNA_START=109 /DNA_END=855 /DNA_ORIENTATION=-